MVAVAFLRRAEQTELLQSSPFCKSLFPADATVEVNMTLFQLTCFKTLGRGGKAVYAQAKKIYICIVLWKSLQFFLGEKKAQIRSSSVYFG